MVEQSQELAGPFEACGVPGWREKGGSQRCQVEGGTMGALETWGEMKRWLVWLWVGEESNEARNWFG